jgi:hypothetical protein
MSGMKTFPRFDAVAPAVRRLILTATIAVFLVAVYALSGC